MKFNDSKNRIRQKNIIKLDMLLEWITRQKTYMAEWTGLEPATPGVTGRYSNQLNYHSAL